MALACKRGTLGVIQRRPLPVRAMKPRNVIAIALLLAGCSPAPDTGALSVEQATALARKLANEQAQARYNCQPFRNGPPARLAEGRWIWQDLKAQGQTDVEGSVSFAPDGANPSVRVILLDNRLGLR